MYHVIEELFEQFINYATLLAEFAGVLVLLYTLIFCFIQWCRRKPDVRLKLAEGIATALEFKMCGEVLRTVVIRQWEGLLLLGAIFALRAAMTLLIHWEIKGEKNEEDVQGGEGRLNRSVHSGGKSGTVR